MVKIDRRRRPTPRWEPPSRTTDTTDTIKRLGHSLAIAATLRRKETPDVR